MNEKYRNNIINSHKARQQNREIFRQNLIEKKFNKLTIKNIIIEVDSKNRNYEYVYCICDCGKEIKTRLSYILNSHTKSCGCEKIFRLEEGEAGFNKVYYSYIKEAKERNLSFDILKDDFKKLIKQKCYYCGKEPDTISKTKTKHSIFIYNGIDRIDNSKGYIDNNVVTSCLICNRMKFTYSMESFKNHIEQIYKHFINKDKE